MKSTQVKCKTSGRKKLDSEKGFSFNNLLDCCLAFLSRWKLYNNQESYCYSGNKTIMNTFVAQHSYISRLSSVLAYLFLLLRDCWAILNQQSSWSFVVFWETTCCLLIVSYSNFHSNDTKLVHKMYIWIFNCCCNYHYHFVVRGAY